VLNTAFFGAAAIVAAVFLTRRPQAQPRPAASTASAGTSAPAAASGVPAGEAS
jgi:hypothetical protein